MSIRIKIFLFFALLSYFPALAQVDTAWVRRYNGPENFNDEANALVVDDSGNVYVTGWSYGSGTYEDYATIKYAPNGDTLWVRRYNGSGIYYDAANALALDGSGNLYVTGSSGGDYATIKYAPNGDTLWVRRYNGPGISFDQASALAVDGSGNLYVTGQSSGSGTSADYATIKYAPNGDTLWVRRYNGPGNGYDNANALTVDDSGNVYVTGESPGSGTNYDYATIKYAPNGDTLWVRRYNGPYNRNDEASALAVDGNGNVYVTGRSAEDTIFFPNYDFATIKYAPNGDTVWIRRYNGPGNNEDMAFALAVDGSGNVYVAGIAYSADSGSGYTIIKYAPNGDTVWLRNYFGPGNIEYVEVAMVLDYSKNVYVTGSGFKNGILDYVTVKYAAAGDFLWVRRYNGPANDYDYATDLAVDTGGNVYVTGFSDTDSSIFTSSDDYATIKYVQFTCVDTAGDANGDGKVNLTDIIFKVNAVFKGGPKPSPLCRGDDNGDSKINLVDIIYEVNYVFKGGPKPLKSRECCL